jgi:thiol-disulfide isomerase/thioredoxin
MQRLMAGVVVLLLAGGVALGEGAKTVNELRDELIKEFRAAKAPKEQKEVMAKYAPRFLELAQKNAKDASAFDALVWVVQLSGDAKLDKDAPITKALAILEKDFAKDKRVPQVIAPLAGRGDGSAERIAKAIMAKNPDRKAQAKACKALVKAFEQQVKTAAQIESNEKFREFLEKNRGKDYVKNILDNAPKYKKSAEAYKKMLATKYAGAFPDLSIGKVAPEVVSKDLDGKEVKLSQYRGKVVVLDIWATWCGPCRAMIPHERELVKKLEGKKFALISISADAKKETLTNFLKKEPMPWVHWWNGTPGGILEDWDVQYFPTIYVLDHKGVIRYKDVRNEEMDKAVMTLLKEMDEAKKVSSR